jgi:adenine-specific DNA-methyltransferase
MTSFEGAHKRVQQLCDHFDARRDEIMSPEYREATARAEFITPFFEALGWDVNNTAHRTIYDKDCVLEKAEAHGGTQRSADYAFRRPGTHLTAFFVEAKKPSIDIRHHDECYQTVLYGWNASTPLVVLTDFEQFLILDARSRPDKRNAASHILRENGSYTYRDYRDAEKFTEIWGLFSREAVADGSIDKAAAALPRLSGRIRKDELFARGTRAVDDDFLAQMERWRESLAKSLKRTNQDLNGEELTSITQRVLDRLIFLRFLEDRLIERDVTFDQIGRSGSAWRDFERVSDRLDARYNGIVYKHDRDGVDNPGLYVDDATFAGVVEHLEPRNSDYKFATIPVTILGSIYERFLGNVIVATDKTARVEPKPEVRKAGGVYYTPDYIVRYIVDQTVGRCIAKKTPKQIEEMRFADIACGSGSFLVEVFATLIRYHLRWYIDNGAAKWEKRGILRRRETDGDYVLTLAEKRRILLNNIYGVDIDQQAVEVTQLSLYLRLLEDESFPSTQLLFDLEHHALLPDLRDNIICGNSLIETDIADLFGLTPEEAAKIHPLDIRYAFKDIKAKKDGGMFDAVVGNPPYVQLSMEDFRNEHVNRYLRTTYGFSGGRLNTFAFFLERARALARTQGRIGYIVPNTIVSQEYYEELRRRLLDGTWIEHVTAPSGQIFDAAVVETVVLICSKVAATPAANIQTGFHTIQSDGTLKDVVSARRRDLLSNYKASLIVPSDPAIRALKDKLDRFQKAFGDKLHINQAIALKHDRAACLVSRKLGAAYREVLDGRHIGRYFTGSSPNYFKFDLSKIHSCKREDIFLAPAKILFRRVGDRLIGTLDTKQKFALNTLVVVTSKDDCPYDLRFILGIFNSSLMNFVYVTFLKSTKKVFSEIQARQVAQLPLPCLDMRDRSQRSKHDALVKLVDKMLTAKKAEAEAEGARREHWTRQCEALDRQIDALVYELYGLTDKEIALVEQTR